MGGYLRLQTNSKGGRTMNLAAVGGYMHVSFVIADAVAETEREKSVPDGISITGTLLPRMQLQFIRNGVPPKREPLGG